MGKAVRVACNPLIQNELRRHTGEGACFCAFRGIGRIVSATPVFTIVYEKAGRVFDDQQTFSDSGRRNAGLFSTRRMHREGVPDGGKCERGKRSGTAVKQVEQGFPVDLFDGVLYLGRACNGLSSVPPGYSSGSCEGMRSLESELLTERVSISNNRFGGRPTHSPRKA